MDYTTFWGGIISPMDGIGPHDLEIESLVERVEEGTVKEIILALASTMEGRHDQLLYLTQAERYRRETISYRTRYLCWRRT